MWLFCSVKKFFIWFVAKLDSLSYFAQPKYWISVEYILISFRWIHRKSFNSVHSAKWDARSALIKRQMTSGSVKFHSIDNANASTLTTPLNFTTIADGWKNLLIAWRTFMGRLSNELFFYWNGKFSFISVYCCMGCCVVLSYCLFINEAG